MADDLPNLYRLEDIARRARTLLHARRSASAELEQAAQNIEMFLDHFYDEAANAYNDPEFSRGSISDARALQQIIDAYDLESDPDFPGGQAYEYFAVLALSHALDAALYLNGSRAEDFIPLESWGEGGESKKEKIREIFHSREFQHRRAADRALEAMEALCVAEQIKALKDIVSERDNAVASLRDALAHADDLVEMKAKQKISELASRNGSKAHIENREMKRQSLAWYVQHRSDFPSMDKAAEAMARLVPIAVRTARKWVGEFNRELPPAGTV